jgi:hypothetical protein
MFGPVEVAAGHERKSSLLDPAEQVVAVEQLVPIDERRERFPDVRLQLRRTERDSGAGGGFGRVKRQ